MAARRYLVVIQAPGGYPAPGEPLEDAPVPPQPMVHTVVMADDYEALEAENARLRSLVEQAAADDTPPSEPGVYCTCLAQGSDPRTTSGLRCVYATVHAAGLDAAAARAVEHSDAQLGAQF